MKRAISRAASYWERPLDRHDDVQPGLPRRFDSRRERHLVEQRVEPHGDLPRLVERRRAECGLLAPRLAARVDERVDVEDDVVRILDHRALQRGERRREVGAAVGRIRPPAHARMPDVELERAHVSAPQKRREVVAQDVLVGRALALREHAHALDEIRQPDFPVLHQHAPPGDALGPAEERQRPVARMFEKGRRHAEQVAQEVPLGDCRLLERGNGGPVDAIQMRDLDLVAADVPAAPATFGCALPEVRYRIGYSGAKRSEWRRTLRPSW